MSAEKWHNRKWRKRNRRKLAATARLQTAGGLGTFSPRTRSDWRLVHSAIVNDWETPQTQRNAIMADAEAAITNGNERLALAVVKVVVAADMASIQPKAI